MKKFILIILVFLVTFANADTNLNPVRLDSVSEAWLEGNIDKCYSRLLEIYNAKPDSFTVVYNLGYINLLNGNYSQALSFFEQANKINPKYPYVHLNISKIYENSGNLTSAKNVLLLGQKAESDNYEIQLALARVYKKLGKMKDAIELYSSLVDDFDDEIEPRIELASIYRQQKNLKAALQLIESGEDEMADSQSLLEKYKYHRDANEGKEAKQTLLKMYSTYPNVEKLEKYQDTLRMKYHVDQLPEPKKLPEYNFKLDPEEKINYMVEYGFIKLGWMKIRIEDELIINGRKIYHIVFYVDSNPDFDFIISLHHIYESFIDAETLSIVRSRLYTPGENNNFVRMYYFDYDKNSFNSFGIKSDGRFNKIQLDLPNTAQDGTSMLFWARGIVSNKSSGTTIAIINEKYKYAVIDFLDEKEEVEVKNSSVIANKIFAQAKFSGIAGMNGDAHGWFSTDNQSIPLVGKIEIIVGSITVRIDDEK